MIIDLETTGYETIHKILLTLACHLGGATLHSSVVCLDQRNACLKQSLLHPFLYRASLALEEIAIKTKPAGIIVSRHSIGKQDFGFLRLVDENWRGSIDGERIVQCLVVIMSLCHYVIKDSGLSFSPLIKLYFKYNYIRAF